MITAHQINQAIAAHGLWRDRLHKAIEAGASEFSFEQVNVDTVCDFGRWLYALPESVKQESIWQEIQAVHSQFHHESARILNLALKGSKKEALQALDGSGKYMQLTGKLIILLTRWSKELK